MEDYYLEPSRKIISDGGTNSGVISINSLSGPITINATSPLTITPSGNTLTFALGGTSGFVSKTGDIMTGNLQMAPSNPNDYGLRLSVNTGMSMPANAVEGSVIYQDGVGIEYFDGSNWNIVVASSSINPLIFQNQIQLNNNLVFPTNPSNTSLVGLKLLVSTTDPVVTSQGALYYNSSLGGLRYCDGAIWHTVDSSSGLPGVTSVGLSAPAFLTVGGSPVTTSGALALTLTNQSANLVFASAVSGGVAQPAFRSLVAADLPLATVSLFGAVKPDGTSITITGGVISSTGGGGGSGTVTSVSGTGAISVASETTTPVISVATATTSILGVVKPDGTTISISDGVISVIGGGGGLSYSNFVEEIPSGTVNGTNDTFSISYTPESSKIDLYLNGVLQAAGSSNDYTLLTTRANPVVQSKYATSTSATSLSITLTTGGSGSGNDRLLILHNWWANGDTPPTDTLSLSWTEMGGGQIGLSRIWWAWAPRNTTITVTQSDFSGAQDIDGDSSYRSSMGLLEIQGANTTSPIDTLTVNTGTITTGVSNALVIFFQGWGRFTYSGLPPTTVANWTLYNGTPIATVTNGDSFGCYQEVYTGDTSASGTVVTEPFGGGGDYQSALVSIACAPTTSTSTIQFNSAPLTGAKLFTSYRK